MRILHLSDLHIGKKLNGFSLEEDQLYIHRQILEIARAEGVQAVVIAGDVFDRANPSAASVRRFDDFLNSWAGLGLPVFIISGNHDSAERIAFGQRLFSKSRVYISPVYNGSVSRVALSDEYGEINFYLLPFVKPAAVRPFFPEENIESYNEAVRVALRGLPLDKSARNVLIAHQFVTGAYSCDSEEAVVGGLDNIDAELFADFDYAALGHIHTPQSVKRNTVRYCGTALKYSFSEAGQTKSVTIVDFSAKGEIKITEHSLKPLRDMRKIKGSYEELTARENYAGTNTQDYLSVTLTDEDDIPDAVNKLRSIYPNVMQLSYDNARTRSGQALNMKADGRTKSPLDLFGEFYRLQNNRDLSNEQKSVITELIEEIGEAE